MRRFIMRNFRGRIDERELRFIWAELRRWSTFSRKNTVACRITEIMKSHFLKTQIYKKYIEEEEVYTRI